MLDVTASKIWFTGLKLPSLDYILKKLQWFLVCVLNKCVSEQILQKISISGICNFLFFSSSKFFEKKEERERKVNTIWVLGNSHNTQYAFQIIFPVLKKSKHWTLRLRFGEHQRMCPSVAIRTLVCLRLAVTSKRKTEFACIRHIKHSFHLDTYIVTFRHLHCNI